MTVDVKIIRESFEKTKPITNQVFSTFYENLLGDFPESKILFKSLDLDQLNAFVSKSLNHIIDHFDQPAVLLPYLESLGCKQKELGVKQEHYDWAGASLLKTLSHYFGDEWTLDLKEEWLKAYTTTAYTMLQASSKKTVKKAG